MDDLINRQAAIDALDEVSKHYTEKGMEWHPHVDLMIYAIKELPPAHPEQRWIPVSERLPEVGRNVLLSVGKGLYTAEGELKHDGTWVQYRWSANLENVDAWAEMPEPWKGEEDETD